MLTSETLRIYCRTYSSLSTEINTKNAYSYFQIAHLFPQRVASDSKEMASFGVVSKFAFVQWKRNHFVAEHFRSMEFLGLLKQTGPSVLKKIILRT